MKSYHEHIIDEIVEIIKDNLILQYNYCDKSLINIRKYCNERLHTKYKKLDNNTLIYFTEEALAELINCDHLYDFRLLE